ncbi:hypothetical protein L6R53_15435 [Myxococcota bacterium]|nr:hypothetical protein [Myxococcota bacterium]
MADDRRDDGGEGGGRERRPPSLRGLARRLLFDEPLPPRPGADDDSEGEDDPDEQRRRVEARAVLAALLETGDKAKTETIRMVAREVRSYLEALELGKDLHHLLTNYSLEVKASIHLAPLAQPAEPSEEPSARVGLKRKGARGGEEEG